ncbi:MAG: histidine kinase [Flavisolibacter sp.]|nr:histidine kinase [Flavisolibacter sp.]MBD0284588.1 histidine kinase [Flavisolibacter sp.]MBD0298517.1 histidine kinase [Flavisolibacter sp.]MBD0352229.1 histidine kinase [Flavisolibacter sp.]MBD0366035.1 histidine kinase [Flavisolibacter sp.]
MQWHDAIFSEQPRHRTLRHAVFWMAWWFYFSVSFNFLQQPPPSRFRPLYVTVGSHSLLKTFLLVLLYAIASYAFIYYLLPQLLKSKWLKAAVNTLLLGATLFIGAYFLYWNVFPFVDSLFGPYKPARFATKFWPAVSLGLIEPMKVVSTAAIIIYVKYWWLKQRESEKLEREKINAELQLLKAQIHPNFLFTSLNNIYVYSLAASPRAPEMLLKLSDLLSYMLYECDQPLVPLEKEVNMMKDYIELEKIRLDKSIEVELSVRGDMMGKMIAPFLLLPFIENSFKQSSLLTEQAWINMDISIEGDVFSMKLANGIMPETTIAENGLADVLKRLTLIYPQKHELKISQEREMLIVLLKIQLTETVPAPSVENEELSMTEPAIT